MKTVAILATGPSLHRNDVDQLKGQFPVIAINDAWRLAPWADILYACDERWWTHYNFVPGFRGEKWTQNQGRRSWPLEANRNGLNVIKSRNAPGLSFIEGLIHTGYNSGFQALNLAVLWGYKRIILLGYDCSDIGHFFGEHPPPLRKKSPYSLFRKSFIESAPQLKEAGIEVVNCSRQTTIQCFKREEIRKYITAS